jgi:putative acetyltransferase
MLIRKETPADIETIGEVTIAAFNTLPISQHTEQFIIKALRKAGVLTISLVAEIDGAIVGHIAFSPITISDGTAGWFGLGPISVLPKYHRQGIGTALMNAGLAELKKLGAKGCALVGHPDFYKRFGFRNLPQLVHEGIPQEFFLVLPLTNEIPGGTVTFHESFMARS